MALTLIKPEVAQFSTTRIFFRNFTGMEKHVDVLGRHEPSFGIKVTKDEDQLLQAHGIHTEKADGEDILRIPIHPRGLIDEGKISIRLEVDDRPLFIPVPQNAWGQLDYVDAFYNVVVDLEVVPTPGVVLRTPTLNKMIMLHKYREDSPLAG